MVAMRKHSRETLAAQLALHVLTDRQWSRERDTLSIAEAAIAGGATVIQLRDKTASTRLLIEEGLVLRELTRRNNVLFIVNDRVDVALAVDADGAHIGQDDLPAALARQLLGPKRILGISAGNLQEAEKAVAAGADYLGVGPIFPTRAKSDAGAATSPVLLSEIVARYTMPLVAIGGITPERIEEVVQAGALGVAVIRAVVNAADIQAATRDLRQALDLAGDTPGRSP
jgi:thiamine-phosphate diphosphorylase